jgi:hypothetical protein
MDIFNLLCIASKVEGMDRWLESLKHLRGQAQMLVWMYEPYFDEELKSCPIPFEVIDRYPVKFPVVSRRFDPAWEYMSARADEWFLSTDISDVIFQRPLDEFPAGAEAVVCSEEHLYGDNKFFAKYVQEFYPEIADSPVFNVGQVAMRGQAFCDYILSLYDSRRVGAWLEQPELAAFLVRNGIAPHVEDNWLCVHKRYDEFDLVDGTFVNRKTRKPYSSVHAPGNSRFLLDQLPAGVSDWEAWLKEWVLKEYSVELCLT